MFKQPTPEELQKLIEDAALSPVQDKAFKECLDGIYDFAFSSEMMTTQYGHPKFPMLHIPSNVLVGLMWQMWKKIKDEEKPHV